VNVLLDVLSWACLLLGSGVCVIGGAGMLRMPDFYTRAHAAGLTDTLGAGLILLGLAFQTRPDLVTVKLAMVMILLFITSPTACHALVKAAYSSGVRAVTFQDDVGHGEKGGQGDGLSD
jgi:multicomponent Na+:H+ antiporter subunit G